MTTLRRRYLTHLAAAASCTLAGVGRIKLTPKRVAAAAASLRASRHDWRGQAIRSARLRAAMAYTVVARRRGLRARLRLPDGWVGSYYVSLGDGRSVRFASHPAPMVWADRPGKLADRTTVGGGYSRSLGRRHHAATVSVAPGDDGWAAAWRLLD